MLFRSTQGAREWLVCLQRPANSCQQQHFIWGCSCKSAPWMIAPPRLLPPRVGVTEAKRQLRHAFQVIAWLHMELGVALPEFVGRIVVPASQLRAAQHLLRGSRALAKVPVPGGSAMVVFQAGSL